MKRILLTLTVFLGLLTFTHADLWSDLAQFKTSDSLTKALPEKVHQLINETPAGERREIESKLLEILGSSTATIEAKQFCFRMLQRIGSDASVSVVAEYLLNEQFASYALYVLGAMQDSERAEEALLAALAKAPDHRKIALMGSLADRKSQKAVPIIVDYVNSDNVALAQAAFDSLSRIGGPKVAQVLSKASARPDLTPAEVKVLIARAANIVDPGSFYSVSEGGVEPVGQGYVQFDNEAGWQGEYFNNRNFSGEPVLIRRDEKILFNWKHGSPNELIGKNDFSVRWTGVLTAPETRSYSFSVDTDDGVKVTIGDTVLFDHLGGGLKDTKSFDLQAGEAQAVIFQFVEGGGEARAFFTWDCASPESKRARTQKIIAIPQVAGERSILASDIAIEADQAVDLVIHGQNASIQVGAFRKLIDLDLSVAKKLFPKALQIRDGALAPALLRLGMENEDLGMRDILVTRLGAFDASSQRVVLGAITEFKLEQYEDALLLLLANTEGEAQDAVVYSLASIGGVKSFSPLYKVYQQDQRPSVSFAITQLRASSVDEHLLKTVADEPDMRKHLTAVTPLVLRNPKGAVELFNKLAASGQPDDIRKAAYGALETIGNVQSAKVFVSAIQPGDAWMRPAQGRLKRMCIRLDKGHDIWNAAFKPVLKSGADVERGKALLAIVDGVPCNDSRKYLAGLIKDEASPLRDSALRALSKWPSFDSGKVWLELISSEPVAEKELRLAQKSLVRILSRDEIRASWKDKMNLALNAVQSSNDATFKQAIIASYEGGDKGRIREIFSVLIEDPDVGAQVAALIKK